jgi:hypothetical protein
MLQFAVAACLGFGPSAGNLPVAWRDIHEMYPVLTHLVADTYWIIGVLSGFFIARGHREAPVIAAGAAAITACAINLGLIVLGAVTNDETARLARAWPDLLLLTARWTLCMVAGGVTCALIARPLDFLWKRPHGTLT